MKKAPERSPKKPYVWGGIYGYHKKDREAFIQNRIIVRELYYKYGVRDIKLLGILHRPGPVRRKALAKETVELMISDNLPRWFILMLQKQIKAIKKDIATTRKLAWRLKRYKKSYTPSKIDAVATEIDKKLLKIKNSMELLHIDIGDH